MEGLQSTEMNSIYRYICIGAISSSLDGCALEIEIIYCNYCKLVLLQENRVELYLYILEEIKLHVIDEIYYAKQCCGSRSF